MKALLLVLIRIYKNWISPALPTACRYMPTCSEYAMEAVEEHGALRGTWLALRRLARCHPFGGHGADPVPPREEYQCCRGVRDLKGHGFSRATRGT
ncbi:MAG TPA: membrane protein insertion efficiency factor YidD [candidate division Zixibacteria bacterium]|nr:membrane protein insertion efficiency factor YidD [candidate division Zixibacteria bacterium]